MDIGFAVLPGLAIVVLLAQFVCAYVCHKFNRDAVWLNLAISIFGSIVLAIADVYLFWGGLFFYLELVLLVPIWLLYLLINRTLGSRKAIVIEAGFIAAISIANEAITMFRSDQDCLFVICAALGMVSLALAIAILLTEKRMP